jgi:hypothetical protein
VPAGRPGLGQLIAQARGSRAVRAKRDVYRQGRWSRQATIEAQPSAQHFGDPQVRALAARAQRIERTDLARFLGKGNFGAVYALDDDTIVKLPAIRDIHGRTWEPHVIKALLLHEAGISNELADAGSSVVPRTIYVELSDGTPALVRERGVEVEHATWTDLAELEVALADVEARGYAVRDRLLVLRRPDGSLFIGDVGLWQAPMMGDVPQLARERSEVSWMLKDWAESKGLQVPKGFPFLSEIRTREAYLASMEQYAIPQQDGSEDFFVKRARQSLAQGKRLRAQMGWK